MGFLAREKFCDMDAQPNSVGRLSHLTDDDILNRFDRNLEKSFSLFRTVELSIKMFSPPPFGLSLKSKPLCVVGGFGSKVRKCGAGSSLSTSSGSREGDRGDPDFRSLLYGGRFLSYQECVRGPGKTNWIERRCLCLFFIDRIPIIFSLRRRRQGRGTEDLAERYYQKLFEIPMEIGLREWGLLTSMDCILGKGQKELLDFG
ncbi:hypothetical protein LguiB_012919 [Lonicera macranthoides]